MAQQEQIFPPPPQLLTEKPPFEYQLLKHRAVPGFTNVDVYRANGGYKGLERTITMQPDEVVAEMKASGLRGRGGAGFPAGMKWSFIPKIPGPKYVTCNTDESEPGTCKDHELIENNPHQLIKGVLITCYAIGSEYGF